MSRPVTRQHPFRLRTGSTGDASPASVFAGYSKPFVLDCKGDGSVPGSTFMTITPKVASRRSGQQRASTTRPGPRHHGQNRSSTSFTTAAAATSARGSQSLPGPSLTTQRRQPSRRVVLRTSSGLLPDRQLTAAQGHRRVTHATLAALRRPGSDSRSASLPRGSVQSPERCGEEDDDGSPWLRTADNRRCRDIRLCNARRVSSRPGRVRR